MFTFFVYSIIIFSIISLCRILLFLVGADIYSIREHLQNKKKVKKSIKPKYISIIIPAHNESKVILRCLKSILSGSYPKKYYKIYVANNGSTDKTADRVQKYKIKNRIRNLRLVNCPTLGKANALNFVLHKYVKSELVMCLDADSYLEEHAVENAVKHFSLDRRLVALASNVRIIDDGSLLSLVQQFEYLVSHHLKKSLSVFNTEYIVGGVGSTFRTAKIRKIGFYDTNTLTEDIDLTMKIIRVLGNSKNRVKFGSDVLAFTESVMSVRELIKQRFRWKYGRFQTFWKNYDVFFSLKKKHNKILTFIYLPFILYSEMTLLAEPLIIIFLVIIAFISGDLSTFVQIGSIFTLYLCLSILADDFLSLRERIKFILLSPIMYFLFFVMNLVEYISLLKSLVRMNTLSSSIDKSEYSWEHVERSGAKV